MSRPSKPAGNRSAAAPPTLPGLVVASFGRHCLVETTEGERRICHPRGKKSQVVVGDRVQWSTSGDEGSVERVDERRNLFYRQDELRTKSFAANLDQILMLVAADPEFSERQLARSLIAAEAQGIPVLVVLNKSDLQPAFDRSWKRLEPYRQMGVKVMPMRLQAETAASSEAGVEDLLLELAGKTTLVLGPSGVGKSTLVNRLVPNARALTGEISRALNSGKHTTTSTTWYWTDEGRHTALIDSPGFQEFGLNHIEPMQLAHLMPDLKATLGHCRFYNCTHLHEPGCSVRDQVASADADTGTDANTGAEASASIHANRYQIYGELFAELSDKRLY